MTSALSVTLALLVLAASYGCVRTIQNTAHESPDTHSLAELWEEPVDLEKRDLLHGVGGQALAPRATTFSFVARDAGGYSPGFDVRDDSGREWSVKLGIEAQPEVASSRILWAIGFQQPPVYYVSRWTMTGAEAGEHGSARFRPDLPDLQVVGDWSWRANPFVGSQPFRGLIVANIMINNWDWKTSNNKIYAASGLDERRWFVVRDLGASLGKTSYPVLLQWLKLRGLGQGSRNDLPGFEDQGFIKRVDENGKVTFDYRGIHGDLLDEVTVADVRWTCALLARLSERQWQDAFAAAGYTPEQGARYTRKLREKIAQGLALPAQTP
jgi:hypothetical protein